MQERTFSVLKKGHDLKGLAAHPNLKYIPLIIAECEVRTASYGPSFSCFYGPSAKSAGNENKEGKKRGSISCRTDRANEANKMLFYGFGDYSSFEKVIES